MGKTGKKRFIPVYPIMDGKNRFWTVKTQSWDSGSTLVQVKDCCLMALSHYLNQCWLIWERSIDIHQEICLPSIIPKICLKIACLKFHSNLPGVNELTPFSSQKATHHSGTWWFTIRVIWTVSPGESMVYISGSVVKFEWSGMKTKSFSKVKSFSIWL